MKLSLEQLNQISMGCVKVTESSDGFHFHRFTDEEEQYYKTTNTDFYNKSQATAGVQLQFTTDSTSLTLLVKTSAASSRTHCYHDIYCNGTLIAHMGSGTSNKGIYGDTFSLGRGMKNLQIYFPYSAASVLLNMELDDGATIAPFKRPNRMLIYGDSITHGYDVIYPSHAYADILADKLNANALNKGIAAEIFCPGLLIAADPITPDFITVAYGTNDWCCCEREQFLKNMTGFYQRLAELYPNTKIFALTPIWRSNELEQHHVCTFSELPDIIEKAIEPFPNITLINGYHLIPHDITYYRDGLHPNDAGAAFYAERLYQKIISSI